MGNKVIKDTYCVRLSEDTIKKLKYLAKTRNWMQTKIVTHLVENGIQDIMYRNPTLMRFYQSHSIAKIGDRIFIMDKTQDIAEFYKKFREHEIANFQWINLDKLKPEEKAKLCFGEKSYQYEIFCGKIWYDEAKAAYDADVEIGLYKPRVNPSENGNYDDLPF